MTAGSEFKMAASKFQMAGLSRHWDVMTRHNWYIISPPPGSETKKEKPRQNRVKEQNVTGQLLRGVSFSLSRFVPGNFAYLFIECTNKNIVQRLWVLEEYLSILSVLFLNNLKKEKKRKIVTFTSQIYIYTAHIPHPKFRDRLVAFKWLKTVKYCNRINRKFSTLSNNAHTISPEENHQWTKKNSIFTL